MTPMIIETDIGRDADDVFALLYFIASGRPIHAICVSPGDHDQVAVVRSMLNYFNPYNDTKILTPADRVPVKVVGNWHHWLIDRMGGDHESKPDGYEELLPDSGDVFICGPVKMAHLIKNPNSITMQGGFVPYSMHQPTHVPVLDKFLGQDTVPTYNLGGTKPKVLEELLSKDCPYRWIGKNVCHTVVYTPEVHTKHCLSHPQYKNQYNRHIDFHVMAIEEYIREKGAKIWHDPLAATLSAHPELAVWKDVGPVRIKGKFGAVELKGHQSVVDIPDIDVVWKAYMDNFNSGYLPF